MVDAHGLDIYYFVFTLNDFALNKYKLIHTLQNI